MYYRCFFPDWFISLEATSPEEAQRKAIEALIKDLQEYPDELNVWEDGDEKTS